MFDRCINVCYNIKYTMRTGHTAEKRYRRATVIIRITIKYLNDN